MNQLEFDNIEGMILLSELSRRRIRSVAKLIRVDRNEVVVVMRVDPDKGEWWEMLVERRKAVYGQLRNAECFAFQSARSAPLRRSSQPAVKIADSFTRLHRPVQTTSIGRRDCQMRGTVREGQIRRLDPHPSREEAQRPSRDPLPKHRLAITQAIRTRIRGVQNISIVSLPTPLHNRADEDSEPEAIFNPLALDPGVLEELQATIARRLTPKPVKVRADIDVKCFAYAGIDAIRRALAAGEAVSTEEVPIKIRLVAPPAYVISTTSTDKVAAIELMEKAVEVIGEIITEEKGELVVKDKVGDHGC